MRKVKYDERDPLDPETERLFYKLAVEKNRLAEAVKFCDDSSKRYTYRQKRRWAVEAMMEGRPFSIPVIDAKKEKAFMQDPPPKLSGPVIPTKDAGVAARWVFDNMHADVTEADAPSSGAWSLLLWARESTDKFHSQYGMLVAKGDAGGDPDKMADEKKFAEDESKLSVMERMVAEKLRIESGK